MITYYALTLILSIIAFLAVMTEYENRKTNFYYIVLILLMTLSNAGYLAISLSTTVEEAILANKIVYLGGSFIPPATLSLICVLTNYRLPIFIKNIMYGFSFLVYCLVLTIGYSDIYYETVYLKTYNGASVIGHTYGPAHILLYVLLYGHVIIQVLLIAFTIVKKRTVSKKNLFGVAALVVSNVYLFIMARFINPSIEILPATYMINCWILYFMFHQGMMYNFDDNIARSKRQYINGFILLNERFRYLGCNDMAKKIFPQLRECIVDKPFYGVGENKYILDWISQVNADADAKFSYEKDGKHYECNVEKLYYKQKLRGYMIEMIDSTDRWKYLEIISSRSKELEHEVEKQQMIANELEIAKVQAESANKAKSQFLARMSHEIRTPINAVIGMDEMILREANQKEIKKYAHDIKTAAKSLLGLINEILDSSKIEAGMLEIIPVRYELASLINDLYNMIIVKSNAKGLKLEFDIDPTIPSEYYGDDIRIKQVLINLLTNAVKYTHEGCVTLHISCYLDGSNAVLHCSVKDTGIGIQSHDLHKLFGIFERIEESKNRNIEGTGLGLNIAYRLLNLMGSELKVKSEYQKGSEFYFDLTQKIINVNPLGNFKDKLQVIDESDNTTISYTAPKAKVLIVDDNEMNRKVFCALVKATKIQVTQASSGKECITKLQQESFDLVFLDHMMPGLDGLETFRIIKKQSLCSDIPVIMLTANVMTGARETYLEEGFHDFLSKPISPDKLDAMLLQYLPAEYIIKSSNEISNISDSTQNNLPEIEEFDFKYAMMNLKNEELILETLKSFVDMLRYLPNRLNSCLETNDIDTYRIEVHALKSSAATVGGLLLSKLARILEVACYQSDIEKIMTLHPILMEEILKHEQRLNVIFPSQRQEIESMDTILAYLDMMSMGISQNDYDTADFMMEELKKYQYPNEVQTLFDELTVQILNMDAEQSLSNIEIIKNTLGGQN